MHEQIGEHGGAGDSGRGHGRPGAGRPGQEPERHVRRLAVHYRQVFARHLSRLLRLLPSHVLGHLPPHLRGHHRRPYPTQSQRLIGREEGKKPRIISRPTTRRKQQQLGGLIPGYVFIHSTTITSFFDNNLPEKEKNKFTTFLRNSNLFEIYKCRVFYTLITLSISFHMHSICKEVLWCTTGRTIFLTLIPPLTASLHRFQKHKRYKTMTWWCVYCAYRYRREYFSSLFGDFLLGE